MMEPLTKRQASVVLRRLAKQDIVATADDHSWGIVIHFQSNGQRYLIETVGQAYRWTGYPKVEGRDE